MALPPFFRRGPLTVTRRTPSCIFESGAPLQAIASHFRKFRSARPDIPGGIFMRTLMHSGRVLGYFAAVVFAGSLANAQDGRVHVPNRPAASPFENKPGQQQAEIQYDPATSKVTIRMTVQDSRGYFVPNIRRENFAVFENNVRQQNATVEIEHAPVSIGVLVEWGGRYQALTRVIADETPGAVHQLLNELGQQDRIAAWKYGNHVETLADFSKGRESLGSLFLGLKPPEFSETNLYDAVIDTLRQMKTVSGRKALVLISSGIDTFSKATRQDLVTAVRACGTPVYVVDLGPELRKTADRSTFAVPYAGIDWTRAKDHLREIAQTSGGRLYSVASTFDLSGAYDDMMENLKVRYVITYKSSDRNVDTARNVRIDLIDPKTAGPLQVIDEDGKPVRTRLSVEASYLPRTSSSQVGQL
jgi:Ca-activated chloride channel homolog